MSFTTKLLINEPPLQVLPSLAQAIGLNESILVQQIHYWVMRSTNVANGHTWVYKTAEDWQKEFPFWSVKTIRRVIKSCEESGIVVTGVFNRMKIDRTKWFRINYEWLDQFGKDYGNEAGTPLGQVVHMEQDSMSTPLPETTPETTQREEYVAITLNAVELWNEDSKDNPKTSPPKKKKSVAPRNNYTDNFEIFWKLYMKGSKSAAFRAWTKQKITVEMFTEIVKAVPIYKAYCSSIDRPMKDAQGWLNDHFWETSWTHDAQGTKPEHIAQSQNRTPSF